MGSKYVYILSKVISFDLAYPPNANPPKPARCRIPYRSARTADRALVPPEYTQFRESMQRRTPYKYTTIHT